MRRSDERIQLFVIAQLLRPRARRSGVDSGRTRDRHEVTAAGVSGAFLSNVQGILVSCPSGGRALAPSSVLMI